MNNETNELKYDVIYKITNTINDKVYIGQSINPTNRLNQHKKAGQRGYDRKNITPNSLYVDMFNQGLDTFTFDIIEEINVNKFDYQRIINEREQYYIELYNSLLPNGYNKQSGGSYNCIVSDETRQNMSNSQKGKQVHHSEEARKKQSESKLGEKNPMYGKNQSEEHRRKRSESMKGKLKGKKQTLETINTRKKILTSLWQNSEYRNNMINSHIGKKTPEETRKNQSDSHKGEKHYMCNKQKKEESIKKHRTTTTIKILTKIINSEKISTSSKYKYKQYIEEYNLTGKIIYLEELLQQKK